MLKKIIVMCLLTLSLVGCGGDSQKTLDVKKTNQLEKMNLTFEYAEVVSRLLPSVFTNDSYYYSSTNKDENYLDIVMSVENTSSEKYNLNDLFFADVDIDESMRVGNFQFETLDFTSLESHLTLEKGQKTRVHLYSAVKKNLNVQNINLSLTIDNQKYQVKTTYQDLMPSKTLLNLGDQLTINNQCDVKLSKLLTTNLLKPDNTSGAYSYYEPDSKDDVLLLLETEIKNTSGKDYPIKNALGVNFYVDGKMIEKYFSVYQKSTKKSFGNTEDKKIKSKESIKVYYCVEIPKSQKDKPIEVRLTSIDGTYYLKK